MVAASPGKIATLFPVPKSRNDLNNERSIGPRQGEIVRVERAWDRLELDEASTTIA